jgi:hypothetical protein
MLTFRCKTCYDRLQHLSIMRAVFMSEWLSGDRALLHASIDVSWAAFHLPIRNSSKVESGQYHAETSMPVVSIPRGAASLPSKGCIIHREIMTKPFVISRWCWNVIGSMHKHTIIWGLFTKRWGNGLSVLGGAHPCPAIRLRRFERFLRGRNSCC